MKPVLEARRDAAQATLDRYRGQPFRFGRYDCCRLAAFHLRQLGYKPALARGGSYSSALGARRALARAGFASLAEALDTLGLERIPPAAAIVGDIVQADGEDAFGALAVVLGNGRIIGWAEGHDGAEVMQMIAMNTAWRVPPCPKS
ncbi:hypothetical protein SAMN06295912_108112 [Sphingomonas laterariae]|uniref:DUF6950 domain-containing protein n=1 Tax=Edaphosphingomonas laterariae TaxID=861865 RepID=A0A239FA81_9SPHN|nr:hypothetical protein [Sphingomonas laterariae]SNS53062.1 hypothetical protein SAMN06295912_108112 [Sphingomonas laterariae]